VHVEDRPALETRDASVDGLRYTVRSGTPGKRTTRPEVVWIARHHGAVEQCGRGDHDGVDRHGRIDASEPLERGACGLGGREGCVHARVRYRDRRDHWCRWTTSHIIRA
jgi:hypothetical protein